jgi:hypothetical protein
VHNHGKSPTLSEGIALTHFIVAADVERATRFYSDLLGGEIVLAGQRVWRGRASRLGFLASTRFGLQSGCCFEAP